MSIPASRSGAATARVLEDLAATESLAAAIAARSVRGDVITLAGDLGTGKTTFARFFIHARGVRGEVPSPTFTLVQLYAAKGPTIWHFDLYRIAGVEEAVELGVEEAFAEGISLIEWPDRIAERLPAERLDIELGFVAGREDARTARLAGDEGWRARLAEAAGSDGRP